MPLDLSSKMGPELDMTQWFTKIPTSTRQTYKHTGRNYSIFLNTLTHWGRVTHICVSKLTIIGSDNGLSPGRRQAIIWTNAGILLIEPLGTNFSEILIEIHTFSFKKMHLKMASAKWRPFCLCLNVLNMLKPEDAYMHQWNGPSLSDSSVQVMIVTCLVPSHYLK